MNGIDLELCKKCGVTVTIVEGIYYRPPCFECVTGEKQERVPPMKEQEMYNNLIRLTLGEKMQ